MKKAMRLVPLPVMLLCGLVLSQDTMTLDFKDTDIRDVIRAVSKAYNINIILDNNVSGKVTVHLTDVPTVEGLTTLAESNGFELIREGNLYRIRPKSDQVKSVIRYVNGKLTVDVQNAPVSEFLQELSSKTAVSIVPDSKVQGRITGKLFQVDLDDGLRALLEGNGFTVTRRRNIYQVSAAETASEQQGGGPRVRRLAQNAGRSDFYVDYSKGKLTLEVTNGNLEDVIKAITEQTDVQVVTYGNVKTEVNAKLFDTDLTTAFALLLGGTNYTFVEKDGIILIGDRNAATPSGQALSKSELIHLKHIKADDVPNILPKNVPATNVKVIKEQNALLISGTSEDIVTVREFLGTIDIPTPQVRIDAVIVEFKENLEKEFGWNYWRNRADLQGRTGKQIPAPKTGVSEESSFLELATNGKAFKDFFGITKGWLSRIPDNFFLVLHWLESQNKAKILAQPSLLTLNGNKATINVDEAQYFKITTGVAENYTVRFQPIKFGIQLSITPWISQGGQITAEIQPEVSNSEKTDNEYPNISTRSMTTTVRLNDGETLVLGGLIKNKEEEYARKIPVLGDLPIIGALFRWSGKSRSKTNLVIYITPHIITGADSVDVESQMRRYDLSGKNVIERKLYEFFDSKKKQIDEENRVDPAGTAPQTPTTAPRSDAAGPGADLHAGAGDRVFTQEDGELVESGADSTAVADTSGAGAGKSLVGRRKRASQ